jgi:hypothetical protein
MSQRMNIVSSYFFEWLLPVLLVVMFEIVSIDYFKPMKEYLSDISLVLGFYGIALSTMFGLIIFLISDGDKEFIAWLEKQNAEKVFRRAAFYGFSMLLICLFVSMVIRKFLNTELGLAIGTYITLLALIIMLNGIKIVYKYVDVKRLYEKKGRRSL